MEQASGLGVVVFLVVVFLAVVVFPVELLEAAAELLEAATELLEAAAELLESVVLVSVVDSVDEVSWAIAKKANLKK